MLGSDNKQTTSETATSHICDLVSSKLFLVLVNWLLWFKLWNILMWLLNQYYEYTKSMYFFAIKYIICDI